MSQPALQRYRLLAQMGFFALFTLTPIFDLFRYDLTENHAYFTLAWDLAWTTSSRARSAPAVARQHRPSTSSFPCLAPSLSSSASPGSGAASIAAGCTPLFRGRKPSTG